MCDKIDEASKPKVKKNLSSTIPVLGSNHNAHISEHNIIARKNELLNKLIDFKKKLTIEERKEIYTLITGEEPNVELNQVGRPSTYWRNYIAAIDYIHMKIEKKRPANIIKEKLAKSYNFVATDGNDKLKGLKTKKSTINNAISNGLKAVRYHDSYFVDAVNVGLITCSDKELSEAKERLKWLDENDKLHEIKFKKKAGLKGVNP